MKRHWVLALLAGAVGAAALAANVMATAPSPPGGITTSLTKGLFDEIDVRSHAASAWQARLNTQSLSDVYVVDNKFQPHSDTGWHSHPGPSLIIVVSGTVTNYESDDPHCAPQVYTAGSGFVDAGGGDMHILRNETDAPAETMAVQILPKDATRRVDAPAPAHCRL
jgi:quercetin dioxygenase-like cupin family protein